MEEAAGGLRTQVLDRSLPLVVVVGGGFGGIRLVRRLAGVPARVALIDRTNHHLFQPLLYQVATSVLSDSDIAFPIRRIFRGQSNVLVKLGEVTAVDRASRHVWMSDGTMVPYDWLVLAAGAGSSYFGRREWERLAPGMKSLEDAATIRARVLRAFEDAEVETDPGALQAHLTFVIVGGGATGVELSGAIRELAVEAMAPDFRRADAARARVVLVEAGDRLLASMSAESSRAALEGLQAMGVEVRLNQPVTEVFDGGVVLGNERVLADTVVWAAGVEGSPLGATLGTELDRSGRVKVLPDCSVPGSPQVFVIGDMAAQVCARTGQPVPGVAPGAMQMADMVGRIIADEIRASERNAAPPDRPAFAYFDKGSMATIGRARAVAEVAGLRMRGLVAWLAWLLIHVVLLVGFRNRLLVILNWAFAYVAYTKGARLITGPSRSHLKAPLGTSMRSMRGPPPN
jgi:NADH dehydrogenase